MECSKGFPSEIAKELGYEDEKKVHPWQAIAHVKERETCEETKVGR